MWYLIFALVFGPGNQSSNNPQNVQQTMDWAEETPKGDINGGDTSTPIPPRPPVKR